MANYKFKGKPNLIKEINFWRSWFSNLWNTWSFSSFMLQRCQSKEGSKLLKAATVQQHLSQKGSKDSHPAVLACPHNGVTVSLMMAKEWRKTHLWLLFTIKHAHLCSDWTRVRWLERWHRGCFCASHSKSWKSVKRSSFWPFVLYWVKTQIQLISSLTFFFIAV